jgi:recombination protein RecR
MRYPAHLSKLIDTLKKLPGIGTKSAERFAFNLLSWNEEDTSSFSSLLKDLHATVTACSECGCLTEKNRCGFCSAPGRDCTKMCIIASPKDAFMFESTHEYRGLYHVLETLLSPLDGGYISAEYISALKERIQRLGSEEIIIALDSTLEGDATALFLKQELSILPVTISRLAFGLPMGSALEYVDEGTLARALLGRQNI